jgi:uncharacterized RDD family membrane protein YckC
VNSRPSSQAWPKHPLPPGLALATMRQRVIAWFIDGLILVASQLAFWIFAVVVGAVSIDSAAAQQIQNSPLAMPTVAPYSANLPFLAILLSVFVALTVGYVAVAWARFRATPGQKVMSLEVASAATGRNLGLGRALARSLIVVGIPLTAVAGVIYGLLAYETSVPWADAMNPAPGGPAEAWLTQWSDLLFVGIVLAAIWPFALLLWTFLSPTRQGIHDRAADSLVVAQAPWARWAATGYQPGYDPAAIYGPTFGASPYGPQQNPGVLPPDGAGEGAVPDDETPPAAWRPIQPIVGSDESEAPPKIVAATVGRRATAYLIDCVLIYMIYGLTYSIGAALFLPSATAPVDDRTFVLFGLAGGAEQLVYFASGWALWQGTLAQKLMRLRVADATTGKSMGWLDAIVRWAVMQWPFALVTVAPAPLRFLLILTGASWLIFLFYSTTTTPDTRGLHDRFMNTRVSQDL